MAYTQQDRNFVQALKAQGVSAKEAIARLEKAKANTQPVDQKIVSAVLNTVKSMAPSNLVTGAAKAITGGAKVAAKKGIKVDMVPSGNKEVNKSDQTIAEIASTLTPQGLYAKSGLPGSEFVKKNIVDPTTSALSSGLAAGRSGIQNAWDSESTTSVGDRLTNAGSNIITGAGNVIGGVADVVYAPMSPLNPFDTRTMSQKSRLGIGGLNKAIAGGGQVLGAPLDLFPTVKAVISSPFAVIGGTVATVLKDNMGIDPNSEMGQNIINSTVNAAGMALIAKGMIKKGYAGMENGKPVRPTFQGGMQALDDTLVGMDRLLGYKRPLTEPQINAIIDQGISKGVKPIKQGKSVSEAQATKYTEQSRAAVKDILNNKDSLDLRNADGEQVPLPQTIEQLQKAISQGKQRAANIITREVQMAKDRGGMIDATPIAKEFQIIANDTFIQSKYPSVARYAQRMADYYTENSALLPDEAQLQLQKFNADLNTWYKNPTPNSIGKANIDSLGANILRQQLNKGINDLQGPAYQEAKQAFGAYSALETDVGHRSMILARQNGVGAVESLAHLATGAEAVNAIMTQSPTSFMRAAALNGIMKWIKSVNSPDHQIKVMFNKLDAGMPAIQAPPMTSIASSAAFKANNEIALGNQIIELQNKLDKKWDAKTANQITALENQLYNSENPPTMQTVPEMKSPTQKVSSNAPGRKLSN